MLKSKLFFASVLLLLSLGLFTEIENYNFNYKSASVSSLTKSKPVILHDATFDESISKGIYLVDFWATWCGPCRRQAPILEEIAAELGDKITIGKLDIDHNRKTASAYYVRSIPTMILFKDGKVEERIVGLHSKAQIMKVLRRYL